MVYPSTIEVADAKNRREPAGWELWGGRSAEFRRRARLRDGDGENISATVRGRSFPWLRYLLTMPVLCKVGRERLPAFFVTKFRQMPHIVQNIFSGGTNMDIRNLKGSIVALVTPFNADGSVNFDKLRELVEWHIENKTDAILTLGTTGESSTMTHEEDDATLRCVIEAAAGRVPVIAGTGSNSTQTMLEKSLRAEQLGADGLLLITPYYNKANAEGMYRHFVTVADAVHIPCILYNVPGRTGCSISVENVERLSKHPNICGIKEASGDMSYAMKIAHCIGPDFALWSGNDDITIPLLSIGGSGVISVWANVMPREVHDMVMDYLEGRREQAVATAVKYLDLANGLFMEVNPIPVKTALNMMGKEVGPFRLPLYEMTQAHQAQLWQLLQQAGVIA